MELTIAPRESYYRGGEGYTDLPKEGRWVAWEGSASLHVHSSTLGIDGVRYFAKVRAYAVNGLLAGMPTHG